MSQLSRARKKFRREGHSCTTHCKRQKRASHWYEIESVMSQLTFALMEARDNNGTIIDLSLEELDSQRCSDLRKATLE